ncbi:MAG: PAS domain-containing protein [Deltaproteobacteria bacterium]|nr:PAS domain-containing protein [Deltaproteobacteria bacterium]
MAESDPRFLGWLLDSMRSGLVAIDRAGVVVRVNPGARRMLGLAGRVVGQPCRDALPGQPAIASMLESALDGRERPSRAELVLEPAAGESARTIGFTLDPVRSPEGEVSGAVLVFRDLTPFERQDEQERLRDRLAALGQMAAGLAHELRNPLAGMEVLAGLLKRRLAGRPEELAMLAELSTELRSLSRTVTESLEFVRPLRLAREKVDPVGMLEEALALARSRVPFEGAIERAYDEDVPEILADAEQIRAVETNLIVNAFEAMHGFTRPEGHRLRLGLGVGARREVPATGETTSAHELLITVCDSGPGIESELRERVFHPFFSTKPRGSGVGLAHAQKVVASHGGLLELDGHPGQGAVFRIRLPIEAEAIA